jgi:hypothetical protein
MARVRSGMVRVPMPPPAGIAHLVVASESARFSQTFSKRGLSVDFGASWLLPRLIGLHRAKALTFFADINAQEAAEFGVVNRVVLRRPARRVRGRVGPTSGCGPPAGPLPDQDDAQQLPRTVHGPGSRGGDTLAGRQFRHGGHHGGDRRLQREAATTVQGALKAEHALPAPPPGPAVRSRRGNLPAPAALSRPTLWHDRNLCDTVSVGWVAVPSSGRPHRVIGSPPIWCPVVPG